MLYHTSKQQKLDTREAESAGITKAEFVNNDSQAFQDLQKKPKTHWREKAEKHKIPI